MTRPRVLIFTSPYPSAAKRRQVIFFETRLRQLMFDAAGVGAVVSECSPQQLAATLRACIDSGDLDVCRAHAARFGWQPVARELQQLFERVPVNSKQPQVQAA